MTGMDPLVGVTITSREIYDGIVRLTGHPDAQQVTVVNVVAPEPTTGGEL